MIKGTVGIVAIVLLGAFLIAVGVPSPVVIVVSVAGLFGVFSYSRPSIRQEVATPVLVDGESPSVDTVTTFTNVAFSDREPTWKGWPKEVGVVTITPQAITLDGKKKSLTIDAPFIADLHDQKAWWTMVRVKGSTGTGEAATAYLVTRGAPKLATGADAKAMAREAADLVEAINVSSCGASGAAHIRQYALPDRLIRRSETSHHLKPPRPRSAKK